MYFFFLFLLCQILLLCVIYVSMIDIGKMNIYFSIFIFPFFLFVCAVDVVTEMVRLGIFIFLLFLTLVGETSSSSVRHVHSWQQFFFLSYQFPWLVYFLAGSAQGLWVWASAIHVQQYWRWHTSDSTPLDSLSGDAADCDRRSANHKFSLSWSSFPQIWKL